MQTSAITAVSLMHDYLRHNEVNSKSVLISTVVFLSAKVCISFFDSDKFVTIS